MTSNWHGCVLWLLIRSAVVKSFVTRMMLSTDVVLGTVMVCCLNFTVYNIHCVSFFHIDYLTAVLVHCKSQYTIY